MFGDTPMKREGTPVKYDDAWSTKEEVFYRWCKEMYPQAVAEWKAVMDIERSVNDE
jgi:hypothetical protein